jgi:hypothetical protein
MAEGGGRHVIDPGGQARQALRAAVAEYGPLVLSNPATLDGLCQQRLAGMPGEFILIGSAARSDVPALLRQRTATMGIEDAIRWVAETVAANHGLDEAACLWVVTEFAAALGYRSAGGTHSAANAPPFGSADRRSPPPFGSAAAEAMPPRRRGPNRGVLGLAAAGALVAVYLVTAAGAHMVPFSRSSPPQVIGAGNSTRTPEAAADASADASPDPVPDPDPDTSALNSLRSLIPADIQSENACSEIDARLGATVTVECTGVQQAAETLYYYSFATTSALEQGYDNLLSAASFQNSCGASDGSFEEFTPLCQSTYSNSSPVFSGTVSEFLNQDNDPVIASTEDQQLVICVMIGTSGGDLLTFWSSSEWITPGD